MIWLEWNGWDLIIYDERFWLDRGGMFSGSVTPSILLEFLWKAHQFSGKPILMCYTISKKWSLKTLTGVLVIKMKSEQRVRSPVSRKYSLISSLYSLFNITSWIELPSFSWLMRTKASSWTVTE